MCFELSRINYTRSCALLRIIDPEAVNLLAKVISRQDELGPELCKKNGASQGQNIWWSGQKDVQTVSGCFCSAENIISIEASLAQFQQS